MGSASNLWSAGRIEPLMANTITMTKVVALYDLPIQLTFRQEPFRFPRQACRTSVASDLYPGMGRGFRWDERRRRKDISCEPAGICLCFQTSVSRARKSQVRVTSWTKGGRNVSSVAFGVVDHEWFSLKRLRNAMKTSLEAGSQDEDGQIIQEAQAAVARVLLEAGLSQEAAAVVVSKAPFYIRELVQFIVKLETNVLAGGEEAAVLGDSERRGRSYQLAKQGQGRSPFLESLGVHLPSISRISSSLSSQRLPDLLRKVRYFEELLKKSEPEYRGVDGLIQVMMKNLSVSVWEDEDIQRTLSFFEKMKHQGGGIGALENASTVLPLFLEAFPQIFKRSLEHEIKPSIRFLEDLGINRANIRKVILCFPLILLRDPDEDLKPWKRTLKKVGIRVEDMGRMVVKYPWLLNKCVGGNVDDLVQFLESIKVPKSKIDRIITKCPHLLGCSCTNTLMPMVHHINGYGLKSKRLGRAIAQSPELLLHSPTEFDTVVSFLDSVGVEASEISKLLRRSPEILGFSIDCTLQKKIDVLEELGLPRTKLGRIIWFFPEILSMSMELALLPRIKCLRDWGFSKADISRMTFKFPPLLGYNPEAVVSPKLEFLTKTMRRPIMDVVMYPRFFSHSLEKKIKPRARVLEKRQIQCDLQTMLAKSDDAFAAEFLGFKSILIPTRK